MEYNRPLWKRMFRKANIVTIPMTFVILTIFGTTWPIFLGCFALSLFVRAILSSLNPRWDESIFD